VLDRLRRPLGPVLRVLSCFGVLAPLALLLVLVGHD